MRAYGLTCFFSVLRHRLSLPQGVEGGMTDYCHTAMAIHPNMAAGSYLCEVESRLSVETPLFPL